MAKSSVKITLPNGMVFEGTADNALKIMAGLSGNNAGAPAKVEKKYISEAELQELADATDSYSDFIVSALNKASASYKQDGIHAVYSGLNGILKRKFKVDPRVATESICHTFTGIEGGKQVAKVLHSDGLIDVNITKGGVRVRLHS